MRLPVNSAELAFLESIGVENRDYTRDELEDIAEGTVAEYLMTHGFTENQEDVNEVGAMCEDIIDRIYDAIGSGEG